MGIEYNNYQGEITNFWVAIKDIHPVEKTLSIEGLNLKILETREFSISIPRIRSSYIVEGSYYTPNAELIEDIYVNPAKYKVLFDNVANLKTLEYLSECNKLDSLPYTAEHALVNALDADRFKDGEMHLSDEQFRYIVNSFNLRETNKYYKNTIHQLAMNYISINTKQGLYVLAYRKLYLDVAKRCLIESDVITLNRRYALDREHAKADKKLLITDYLDPAEMYLLDDVEANLEAIKDSITDYSKEVCGVDDMPYILAIDHDFIVDLEQEYQGIHKMYVSGKVTVPVDAFFGQLTSRPNRRKTYSMALLDNQVNLDQLLAIHNAVKYPLTYVQGPPGTGKTKTILFAIITAFFNDKTVLFSSSNNHPIDEVCKKLASVTYEDKTIPFPVLRIGSRDVMMDSLTRLAKLYDTCKSIRVFSSTLDRTQEDEAENMKALTQLMLQYEELQELKERREALLDVLDSEKDGGNLSFQMDLSSKQLPELEKEMAKLGEITTKQALSLIPTNQKELRKYLYYSSARCIKRLDEPKYKELKDIILMTDIESAVSLFSKYIEDEINFKKLLKVFPVVATTCASAYKLSEPKPYFDITIMDEASQCNTAISLVPIIRGKNLMLVGDPQQLNPVIVLDKIDNNLLRKKYGVAAGYDYLDNSIYKTFLACDSVTDEILLKSHYRCHKKIIEFNNQKYYKGKLEILSKSQAEDPLQFFDVNGSYIGEKNTAPEEAEAIIRYVAEHPNESIGIITPFRNQKELISKGLKERGLDDNVTCGTVHAFQGDEKDIILFSLALTSATKPNTYGWLKNNYELVNVATSRARDRLAVFASKKEIDRLYQGGRDDIHELVRYVQSQGKTCVSPQDTSSRALGVKPYSSKTEAAFLQSLKHAMSNILLGGKKCKIYKEVPVSQVFGENYDDYNDLFYTGRFDFVVYEKIGDDEFPILAIELDGKEHFDDQIVRIRDEKKNQICASHGLQLIRVENSYARRYNYIKDILDSFFTGRKTVVKVKKKKVKDQKEIAT